MPLPAIPAVLGFIAKTPKFFGHIFKATKKSTQVFTKASKTIKNSKIYKMTGTLLGEDPIKYMRDAAASALKNGGGVEVLKSFTNGVMNGSNRFDSMNSTALKTMHGENVAGAASSRAGMKIQANLYNQSSKRLSQAQIALLKQSANNKKVLDTYNRSTKIGSVALPGTESLELDMKNFGNSNLGKLNKGFGNKKSQKIKTNTVSSTIEAPYSLQDPNLNKLAAYNYAIAKKQHQTNTENFKIINQNLETSLLELSKKNDENAQIMMTNLGKYNSEMYAKLVNIINRIESLTFQKQQLTDRAQTELISDKLNAIHDYDTKSTEAIRQELMANTQTMHSLYEQERLIEDEYRSMETRANRGINLATLHGMLKQVTEMVQAAFLAPSTIDANAQSVLKEMLIEAAYTTGQLVQYSKEMIDMLRVAMVSNFKKLDNWLQLNIEPFNILGYNLGKPIANGIRSAYTGLGKGLDWTSNVLLGGLLGGQTSLAEKLFDNINMTETAKYHEETFDDQNEKYYYAPGSSFAVGRSTKEWSRVSSINPTVTKRGSFFNKDEVTVRTLSGRLVKTNLKRLEGESNEAYDKRAITKALQEDDEGFLDELMKKPPSTYGEGRDTPKEAIDRKNYNTKLLLNSYIRFSESVWSGQGVNASNEQITLGPIKASEYAQSGTSLSFWKLHKVIPETAKSGTVNLDNGLVGMLIASFEQAAKEGIKYGVTSTFRFTKGASNHNLGIAVDVSMRVSPTISSLVNEKYKGPYRSKMATAFAPYGASYAAMLNLSEVRTLASGDTQAISTFWNNYSKSDEIIFKQWYRLLEIFSNNNLAFGARKFYGLEREKNIMDEPRDLVHIQLSIQGAAVLNDKYFTGYNTEENAARTTKDMYREQKKESRNLGNIGLNQENNYERALADKVLNINKWAGEDIPVLGGLIKAYGDNVDTRLRKSLGFSDKIKLNNGNKIENQKLILNPDGTFSYGEMRTKEDIEAYKKIGADTDYEKFILDNFNTLAMTHPDIIQSFLQTQKSMVDADLRDDGKLNNNATKKGINFSDSEVLDILKKLDVKTDLITELSTQPSVVNNNINNTVMIPPNETGEFNKQTNIE